MLLPIDPVSIELRTRAIAVLAIIISGSQLPQGLLLESANDVLADIDCR